MQTISAHDVLHGLIPKLNAVEQQVENTLEATLAATSHPQSAERYAQLKAEFQLELTMIRMNLDHLLKRYSNELETFINDNRQDILLSLDPHEATAIENAKQLYDRVQRLQQDR